MSTFNYSALPLDANEIRILELLPAAQSTTPVRIRIFKATLDNLPDFSAFSYTWGNENLRADISVEEGSLSITLSLETALKAMRSPDLPVLLWIDQICINQNDVVEKAAQIPLMGKIYSLSVQTVGWLGEATPDSDLAMEYFRDVGVKALAIGLGGITPANIQALLAEEADVASEIISIDGPTTAMRESVHRLMLEQGDFFSLVALDGVSELCKLPYFTRGWIQQEVAIPKKFVLKWGSKTLDADIFAAGMNFHLIYSFANFSRMREILISELTPSILAVMARVTGTSSQAAKNIQRSLTLRNQYHSANKRSNLGTARLLKMYSALHFSYANDRIYGVLGLANDIEELGLKVDVERTWEETFTDVAKRIIQKTVTDDNSNDGINFMSLVHFPKSSNTLPSWVPDLTILDGVKTLSDVMATLATPFHASRGTRHPVKNDEQEVAGVNSLLCRGIVVDRITEVGRCWEADQNGEKPPAAGLIPFSDMSKFAAMSTTIVTSDSTSKHPFRTQPQRLAEAEWRVPVLDCESVNTTTIIRRATPLSKVGYDKVKYTMTFNRDSHDMRKLLANIPVAPGEDAELRLLPPGERDLAELKMKGDRATTYSRSTEHIAYNIHLDAFMNRRSFIGERGFVGIGPPGMRVGDMVCVVYGGSFPFVLREVRSGGAAFELVGEAYCDGIMDGEALNMGMPDQELRLV